MLNGNLRYQFVQSIQLALFSGIITEVLWPFQQNPRNPQITLFRGGDVPFDQADLTVLDLQAGDAPGVHAAPVIEKRDLAGFRKPGPVGMPGNGDLEVLPADPFLDPFFDSDEFLVVLGRGRWVRYAPDLQRLPKDTDQKATPAPEGVVPPVRLVAMAQKKFLPGSGMPEDQGLAVLKSRV